MIMTDKDKIKFAIRYLKQGLKSKRTPSLYEELMKELGFVKKDNEKNYINRLRHCAGCGGCSYRLPLKSNYRDEDCDCKLRTW